MYKIIGGKRYNTKTAKEMGSYQFSYPTDFSWYKETLHKKNTGEFFLYGVGGASSKYKVSCGENSWSGSEKITLLTIKEAMEWAEEHLDVEKYEEIFGEVGEDGEMPGKVQISIWVTEGQRKAAQEIGLTHGEVYAAGLKALTSKSPPEGFRVKGYFKLPV